MGSKTPAAVIRITPKISLMPKGSSAHMPAVIVPALTSVIKRIASKPGLKIEAPHMIAKLGGRMIKIMTGTNQGRTEVIAAHCGMPWPCSKGTAVKHRATRLPQKKSNGIVSKKANKKPFTCLTDIAQRYRQRHVYLVPNKKPNV